MVVLRIAQLHEVIRIEVVDWGQGLDYRPRSEPSDQAGGWELYLVEQPPSRWGIDGGTPKVVWFELDAG